MTGVKRDEEGIKKRHLRRGCSEEPRWALQQIRRRDEWVPAVPSSKAFSLQGSNEPLPFPSPIPLDEAEHSQCSE